jgi:undecaprenyl-phosphate glucose phosphotransferase
LYRRVENWPVGPNAYAVANSSYVRSRDRGPEESTKLYSFRKGKNFYRFFARLADPVQKSIGLAEGTFDCAAAVLLLAVLAPALLLIAAAIRLDSPGPVFFGQERHGRRGTVFKVYKFRTMHVTEGGLAAIQCRKDDPRVTRVGALLRRASIDELPQLINVLRGEMALVGPRPHPLSLDREYAPRIRRYGQRYAVKPGMTGLAQIRGYRGPTERLSDMAARVASDLEYVRRRSLAFDLWILVKTVPAVFGGRNAL